MSFYSGYPAYGTPISPLARSIAPAAPLSYGLPLNASYAPQTFGASFAAPLTSSQVYNTGFRQAATSVAPYATAPLYSQAIAQPTVVAHQPTVFAQPSYIPQQVVAQPSYIPQQVVAQPSYIPQQVVAQPSYVSQQVVAQPSYVSQQVVAQPSYVSQRVAAQPVVQQAAASQIKGHSEIEYIPFEKQYQESVPVERVEYVPVERKYTDYYAIENQVEYVPYTTYNTIKEVVPQARTEYVPQQRVEQVAQSYTEYVPVDRVQQSVDYQPVERTLVHYPQVDRQFVAEAERSGRIRYGGASLVGAGSFVGQNAPVYAPSVGPVAAPLNFSHAYSGPIAAPIVSQIQGPLVGPSPYPIRSRNEIFPRGRDKESLSKLNEEIKKLEDSILKKRKDAQDFKNVIQ